MRRFVFWTGVYNALLAASFLYPPVYMAIGLNIPAPIWGWLLSAFLAYTSLVLIYASKDLRGRAPLVYWEALLRYSAGLLLIAGGFLWNLGLMAAVAGAADILIGLVYTFGLPHELGVSHSALLWDKVNPAGRAESA